MGVRAPQSLTPTPLLSKNLRQMVLHIARGGEERLAHLWVPHEGFARVEKLPDLTTALSLRKRTSKVSVLTYGLEDYSAYGVSDVPESTVRGVLNGVFKTQIEGSRAVFNRRNVQYDSMNLTSSFLEGSRSILDSLPV